MSGQSPPRSRRSQPPAHVQQRDTSRSPSLRDNRPRQQKSQSGTQMYSHSNATLQSLGQPSPPIVPNAVRRPSPPVTHRMLPTPPHPNHPIDPTQERRSVSPAPLHHGIQTHYPRPMHNSSPRVLDKYQGDWEITDQLMEQFHLDNSSHSYPTPSSAREETVSPPRDPVERVRAAEQQRTSPNDLSTSQRRRDQQTAARESPKTRDRPQPPLTSTSPNSGTFALHSSENNRGSPYHAGDYTSPYVPHDPQPQPLQPQGAVRRNTVTQSVVQQPSHSPPSAASTRGPGRSLPLQEEGEDDTHLIDHPPHTESSHLDDDLLTSDESTSAARYDTSGGHPSINGRDEKPSRMAPSLKEDVIDDHRYNPGDRDHTSEEYTPRSPITTLPENMMDTFPPQSTVKSVAAAAATTIATTTATATTTTTTTTRPRPRSGATDQLGLRGMETLMEPMVQNQLTHRKPVPDIHDPQQQHQQQQQQQPPPQQHQYPHQYRYDPRTDPRYNNRYYMMDDLHNYPPDDASVYFQSYIQSPRPDAPIPPTPHSQSAAPSPSPLIMGGHDYRNNSRDMPPFSPIAPVGSPFPFPYTHVRRPTHFPHSANNTNANANANNTNGTNAGANNPGGGIGGGTGTGTGTGPGAGNAPTPHIDQALLREQYAKQWQIFAQNNNWGAMSDSTFSPAPTPFQGAFMPWAYLHTQRMFGMQPDAMSMQSSPSHEPVPLPSRLPPSSHLSAVGGGGGGGGGRRGATTTTTTTTMAMGGGGGGGHDGKLRIGSKLRRETSGSVSPPRKPPPRVESTQPRDTSPEPSSSGEETAGEDSYPTPQSSYSTPNGGGVVAVNGQQGYQGYDERWAAGAVVPIGGEDADDDADWVDEDEEVDPEDLLDLEYHPSYVRMAEKRRRKWEIGWEALTQAFQNLDRQTDTTMVLVASPADSSKLHMINSRSIRRTPVLSRSPAMHQLKAAFRGVAQHRRQTRPRKVPILDHFLTYGSSGIGDGSDGGGSSESREGDLRRALDAALNSLDVLKTMYEYRVARWNDEMTRMHQERENVDFTLKQLYGDRPPVTTMMMNGMNPPPPSLLTTPLPPPSAPPSALPSASASS